MDFSLTGFGQRVRTLRRAQGLTQEQLAEAADLNPRTVQKIEAGELNIVVTTLARIQMALGCSAGDLVDPNAVLILKNSAQPSGIEAHPLSSAPSRGQRWVRRNRTET